MLQTYTNLFTKSSQGVKGILTYWREQKKLRIILRSLQKMKWSAVLFFRGIHLQHFCIWRKINVGFRFIFVIDLR